MNTLKHSEMPVIGDLKVETHFAYLPYIVNGKRCWLVKYQYLKEYAEHTVPVVIGASRFYTAEVVGWITISEKILCTERKRAALCFVFDALFTIAVGTLVYLFINAINNTVK